MLSEIHFSILWCYQSMISEIHFSILWCYQSILSEIHFSISWCYQSILSEIHSLYCDATNPYYPKYILYIVMLPIHTIRTTFLYIVMLPIHTVRNTFLYILMPPNHTIRNIFLSIVMLPIRTIRNTFLYNVTLLFIICWWYLCNPNYISLYDNGTNPLLLNYIPLFMVMLLISTIQMTLFFLVMLPICTIWITVTFSFSICYYPYYPPYLNSNL